MKINDVFFFFFFIVKRYISTYGSDFPLELKVLSSWYMYLQKIII